MELGFFKLDSEQATKELAGKIAPLLRPGDCIGLEGDLGAGKTVFARALIRQLAGEQTEVTSPTFALMQPYAFSGGTLWHGDFYRLENESELDALGLDELGEKTILLLEWPSIASARLPGTRLTITMRYGEQNNERSLTLQGDENWKERLKGLT